MLYTKPVATATTVVHGIEHYVAVTDPSGNTRLFAPLKAGDQVLRRDFNAPDGEPDSTTRPFGWDQPDSEEIFIARADGTESSLMCVNRKLAQRHMHVVIASLLGRKPPPQNSLWLPVMVAIAITFIFVSVRSQSPVEKRVPLSEVTAARVPIIDAPVERGAPAASIVDVSTTPTGDAKCPL